MSYYYDRKLARLNIAQFQREEPVQAAVARRLMQLAGYVADVGCSAAFRRKLRNLKMSLADFGEEEEKPSRIRLFAFNRAVDALAQASKSIWTCLRPVSWSRGPRSSGRRISPSWPAPRSMGSWGGGKI